MFVQIAGWMVGGAGLPAATPLVLDSPGLVLGLGLVVAAAAGWLALATGLGLRGRRMARPKRSGGGRLALVSGKPVAP